MVKISPNKISIANLPPYLTDENVIELAVSFGKLKSFILVKDKSTEESRVSLCAGQVAISLQL